MEVLLEKGFSEVVAKKACLLSEMPKEGWLQMAFAGSYQTKQYEKAVKYVNQLVFNFPDKKDYWQQKAGIHQILEDYQLAAVTKELTYKKGFVVKIGEKSGSEFETNVPYDLTFVIDSKGLIKEYK